MLPPSTTDRLAAEGDSVKLCGGFTVRAIVVDAVNVPEVPLIVTVKGPPTMAEFVAVSVKTVEPDVGLSEKLAVTPLGRPLAARVTVPVKPPRSVTVMVSVLLLP